MDYFVMLTYRDHLYERLRFTPDEGWDFINDYYTIASCNGLGLVVSNIPVCMNIRFAANILVHNVKYKLTVVKNKYNSQTEVKPGIPGIIRLYKGNSK